MGWAANDPETAEHAALEQQWHKDRHRISTFNPSASVPAIGLCEALIMKRHCAR